MFTPFIRKLLIDLEVVLIELITLIELMSESTIPDVYVSVYMIKLKVDSLSLRFLAWMLFCKFAEFYESVKVSGVLPILGVCALVEVRCNGSLRFQRNGCATFLNGAITFHKTKIPPHQRSTSELTPPLRHMT